MKSLQNILSLLAICLLLNSQAAFSQRKRDNERNPDLKSRLWYGGGLALGFSSGGGYSIFQFGLSPMVGYKIVEPLSVGPRVAFTFSSLKQSGFKAVGLFNVDAGAFVRYRAFQGLFLQAEGSNEWYQDVFLGSTDKINRTRFNKRVGAGWNFGGGGGGAGSEIAILYNFTVADDVETYENPLEYRFGFTWNF